MFCFAWNCEVINLNKKKEIKLLYGPESQVLNWSEISGFAVRNVRGGSSMSSQSLTGETDIFS